MRTMISNRTAALAAFLAGSIAVFCKWALCVYPSVDDMNPYQAAMGLAPLQSVTDMHLSWGRVSAIPFFWLASKLGIPEFMLGQALFFPVELLFAAVVIFSLRRLRPSLGIPELTVAALIAGFHPGFIEINSFFLARIGMGLALSVMLVYLIFADPAKPIRFAVATVLVTLVAMTSYQGSTNLLFLCIGTVVIGYYINTESDSTRATWKAAIAAVVGLGVAAVADAVLLRILAHHFGLRPFFHYTSLHAMALKAEDMAYRFALAWLGEPGGPRPVGRSVAMILLLVGPLVAALWAGRAGRRNARGAVVLALLFFAVSLQPLSLPFDYDWFPPRTFFWSYFALLAIAATWIDPLYLSKIRRLIVYFTVGAAGIIVAGQGFFSVYSYMTLRQGDFAMAHEIVARLEEQHFDWADSSVYVEIGPRWPRSFTGEIGVNGDMGSLFSPPWSRVPLLGIAAGKNLKSLPEGQASAEQVCKSLPKPPQRYELIIESTRAIVCL